MAKALAESDYNPNSFASAMGVSAPTVAGWIGAASITPTKHIKSELMLRACDLLNIRPHWLILNQEPMRPDRPTNISDEMLTLIMALIDIDHEGGQEREDVIDLLGRLLRSRSEYPRIAGSSKSKP
ncbi:hypothetical protein [Burkholderia cepacia]|uniref:hypothetical protein n=1 Tax=Burkholderia cepacia TaxID=292 RepID=UPI001F42C948|nr:hypothetical protein [Burkholderia cepacia]UIY58136.1 hypothetical protein LZ568_07950 [Burkholderia cepacia]